MAETSGTLRMEAERKSNFKFLSQAKNRLYNRFSLPAATAILLTDSTWAAQFEGALYFASFYAACMAYWRAQSIRRAQTIRGNTVVLQSKLHVYFK